MNDTQATQARIAAAQRTLSRWASIRRQYRGDDDRRHEYLRQVVHAALTILTAEQCRAYAEED